MKEYKVLKNIGANFIIGNIIRLKDEEAIIAAYADKRVHVQFLLDEGYLEEIKEHNYPKFSVGEEINNGGVYTTIIGLYGYRYTSYKYILAWSRKTITDEKDIKKITAEERKYYF